MREIKKGTSSWVHNELHVRPFAWQEGYSAFTVSYTERESVRIYIRNQEEHHRARPFREELIVLLEENGIEYNPSFLD